MIPETSNENNGLFDSIKGVAASLIGIVHIRLDLLSIDLEEERERLMSLLIVMLVGLFCLGVGVVLMTLLIVVAFWDNYRLFVLCALSVTFLTAGIAAWWFVTRQLKTKPRLFASSLNELAKDRQQLTSR